MELTNYLSYGPTPEPSGKFTEYDLALSYAGDCGAFSYTVGAIQYVFPRTGFKSTAEAYASVSLPYKCKPTLTVYYDCDQVKGWYATLCGTHEIANAFKLPNGTQMPVSLTASVGFSDAKYNAAYYGYGRPALADLALTASTTFAAGKNGTVTPSIKYTALISDGLNAGQPRRNNFWAGLTYNYKF